MRTNHYILNVVQKSQGIYLYIATARLMIQIIKRATLWLSVFSETKCMVFYLHINIIIIIITNDKFNLP